MDILLPQTEREFTNPAYWKKFFECNSSFEWYGDYQKLNVLFEKYVKSNDAILQIGCGNSTLAEELHDNGFRNVLSIDTDLNVIVKQKNRNSLKRPSLRFENWSASNIQLADNSINVTIDKGTLDALLPLDSTPDDEKSVESMFREIDRCLAPFGRYLIVTLAQEHIIEKILNYFGTNSKFMIRFQKCDLTAKDFVIPVFAVIITKFKTALSQKRKIEFLNGNTSQLENVETREKLLEKMKAVQQMNWFKHYVTKGPIEETSIKICAMGGDGRYELTIVDDLSIKFLSKYGVFIVPSGRERDWIFSTPKGRNILRKNCELHRLIVVRLSREQHYASLEQIQNELDPIIMDFMPKSCIGSRINYLSLGSTDVTERIETGISRISGKWSVEHVTVNGLMYRRLIFTDSSNLIQSEAEEFLYVGDKCNQWKIDWITNPLCCEHHKHMMIALELLCDNNSSLIGVKNTLQRRLKFAILGLGGGILAKVLHDTFQNSKIVGVELDPEVAKIAIKHFDFPDFSERIHIEICDALIFLRESVRFNDNEKFDIIFVDLSGSINQQGLYCPPPEFVTKEALTLMRNSLLPGGILTLNLVTRDDQLAEAVKKEIANVFESVFSIKGDEDINEVLLCSTLSSNKFSHIIKRPKGKLKKRGKKSKQLTLEQEAQNGATTEIPKWLQEIFVEVEKLNHFEF